MKLKQTFVLTLIALGIAGCATPQFSQQPLPVVTQTQTPVITQTPQGAITNTITTYSTNYVTTVVTNFVPNQTATQIASTIQAIAPVVPAPYSFPLEAGGYLLALIAGGIAAYKNAKANQHLNTLQAVAAGVEKSLPGIVATGANVAQAQAALAAVKTAITAATNNNGTQTNLQNVLSQAALS